MEVDKSTISRELNRNSSNHGYNIHAHSKAEKRRSIASCTPRKMNSRVIALINEKLSLQWSPEQIHGWMRNNNQPIVVSHERIYQYIWADKKAGG